MHDERSISAKDRRTVNADRIATAAVYVLYPVFLIAAAAENPAFLIPAVLVPGVSFVFVSLFRKLYNAPRPYEITGIPPIIKREGKGKSFPSRHVFSAFVIGTCAICCGIMIRDCSTFKFFRVPALLVTAGALSCCAGAVLAVTRVKGGVHFAKDTAAGCICGILLGSAVIPIMNAILQM